MKANRPHDPDNKRKRTRKRSTKGGPQGEKVDGVHQSQSLEPEQRMTTGQTRNTRLYSGSGHRRSTGGKSVGTRGQKDRNSKPFRSRRQSQNPVYPPVKERVCHSTETHYRDPLVPSIIRKEGGDPTQWTAPKVSSTYGTLSIVTKYSRSEIFR